MKFTTAIKASVLSLGLATGLAIAPAVHADDYPSKSINYIIPFGPGGESDISARHQQPFFKKMFGQDLIISYKPGGGGAVGWSQLNSMPTDGYTMMGINLPHIIIKPMQKDVGFKTEDVDGFYIFHYTPDAIVVSADSEFKSLHIPLGSGVTEAACKTVFTQRLKNSGMRWSHEGAVVILRLRTILLSQSWSSTYAAVLTSASKDTPQPYPPHAHQDARIAA